MITGIIGFYAQMLVSLHIGYIETVHINNKTIIQFVNSWSKEVPVNISYPRIFHNIDGYLYAIISPSYVRYITSMGKQMKYRNNVKKLNSGVDYHRHLKNP